MTDWLLSSSAALLSAPPKVSHPSTPKQLKRGADWLCCLPEFGQRNSIHSLSIISLSCSSLPFPSLPSLLLLPSPKSSLKLFAAGAANRPNAVLLIHHPILVFPFHFLFLFLFFSCLGFISFFPYFFLFPFSFLSPAFFFFPTSAPSPSSFPSNLLSLFLHLCTSPSLLA